jgi:hypothetical protein
MSLSSIIVVDHPLVTAAAVVAAAQHPARWDADATVARPLVQRAAVRPELVVLFSPWLLLLWIRFLIKDRKMKLIDRNGSYSSTVSSAHRRPSCQRISRRRTAGPALLVPIVVRQRSTDSRGRWHSRDILPTMLCWPERLRAKSTNPMATGRERSCPGAIVASLRGVRTGPRTYKPYCG